MIHDDRGDCYLRHLQAEHRRWEGMSKAVAGCFRGADEVTWARSVKPLVTSQLVALRAELSKHLRDETQGGCVDEALSRLPSLSADAKRIIRQNQALRQQLLRVMQLVEYGSRREAEHSFRDFAEALQQHERQEERLVAQGFSRDHFED